MSARLRGPAAALLLLALLAPGSARGEEPDPWHRDRRRRFAPPVVAALLDVGALFMDDLPHWDVCGSIALVGRGAGPTPLPMVRAGAHLVVPGDTPPIRLEVGGGIYVAHRRNQIGGIDAAFTLGIRPADDQPTTFLPGVAIRPWIAGEVDAGDKPVLIGLQFTLGVTATAETDLAGRVRGPWLDPSRAVTFGIGVRVGGPWPATDGVDPLELYR